MNFQSLISIGSSVIGRLPIISGVLAIGYLGYRAVVWIIQKSSSQNTTIKNLFPTILKNQSPPPPTTPLKNVSDLTVPAGVIKIGQGEYVLFQEDEYGNTKPITDPELYTKCYDVLEKHSPSALLSGDDAETRCQNRYELLTAALKEIDPSIKAVFVPRTLYELLLIKECLEEDVNNNHFCYELWNITFAHKLASDPSKRKKCFHLCKFNDAHAISDASNPMVQSLKDVAFRLNHSVFETLNLAQNTEGLTFNQLSECLNHQITYMQHHHAKIKEINKNDFDRFTPCGWPSPSITFGSEHSTGSIKSMAFSNEHCTTIVKNAHTLDCSVLAANHFFLYRGADFQSDSVVYGNACQSLSYGNGLFSGFMFDGGATAFHYMRTTQDAFAHSVPYSQANNSVFYIPNTNTLTGLYGCGEIFHGRTKAWQGTKPRGVQTNNPNDYLHLYTAIPKEAFISQYNEAKKEVFNLRA